MRYIFADCVLDTVLAILYRADRAIPLRPKVFHLLQYLLEQRAHLVTKDALCAQVWPGQCISDTAIEGCIKLARQAIGDSGRAQQLIQTRRGYGYRFVGAVAVQPVIQAAGAHAIPQDGLAPPPEPAPARLEPTLPGGEPGAFPAGAGEAALRRPAPDAADGERKLVTLLGCTLAYTPARRDRLGLDDLHSRMRTVYALVLREVQQYGGTISHVTGDRFLAIFGAPVAQEDHARRAVLAACGLRQQLSAHAAGRGDVPDETLKVSMGLHTGLLIMGNMGEATEPALGIVGDLPRSVEALQAGVAPGTIVCSAATARLVRDVVRLEAIPAVRMRGGPPPLSTYTVLGACPPSLPLTRQGGRARSRFVGRTRELATLHALLGQAEASHGQVVGIVGEPGIGKSRLLMEWRQQLHAHGVASLAGHGLSYGSTTPYLPLLDLLREHCGITPADDADVIPTKVREGLQAVGLAPDVSAPALLHLLGVGAEPGAGISPEALKAQAFETLWQLCLQRSQQHPLVIAVDDLHWSDPTSEEFFAFLVERLPGSAILFVGTYRPGYQPSWVGKSYAGQVPLPPLSAQDSAEVVRTMFQGERVPVALTEAILAKAQGNPFFLEELVQTSMEQGEAGSQALQLPLTVQGVLAARIDRLPPEAKHLVQCAAVLGMDVSVQLLQAIAALPEAALQRALAHLRATEFLAETRLVPERIYTFKHTLTQEVVYERLLQERRCTLHTGIVEALETFAGDRVAEQVERLAHHALRGEVWDKALAYCWQAGDKAMARSAHREAVGYFEQALSALAHLPEQRATREQAIDLRLALRWALLPSGDLGRMVVCLREAETLAEALDDPRRLGHISGALSRHLGLMGAYDHAIAAGQRALALATADGDIMQQALANQRLGFAYEAQGDYRGAIDCFGQTLASLDGSGRRERGRSVALPAVQSRAWLVTCHAELGRFAKGRALGDEGLRIAAADDHPASRMLASYGIGWLALRQGDLPKAIPRLEWAVGICQDADLPIWFPRLAATLGAAYTLGGRVADAVLLLTQALEQATAMAMIVAQARCRFTLGEAQALAGRLGEAQALAERARTLARARQERGNEAYALRLLGDIAARRNPPEAVQAEAHYRKALTLADALDMRPLQAHCHRGLGMLYAKTGPREQARTELTAAIEMYRGMEMTFWLPETAAALAQVEAQ